MNDSSYTDNSMKRDMACQTLSTGDIVLMQVYFDEDNNKK